MTQTDSPSETTAPFTTAPSTTAPSTTVPPAALEALLGAMERLPDWVNENEALVSRGRFLDVDCLIDVAGEPFYLSIREGRLIRMERGAGLMRSWRFCIGLSAEGLLRFWAPVPAPGWHDLFALTKRGEAVLEGDLQPLMANLRYFKELLELPRHKGELVVDFSGEED